jgi:hypothetical protein
MFTLPSFKKNLKDKKKMEDDLAMFFCFSIPVLNQRAWFSGKPVPQ